MDDVFIEILQTSSLDIFKSNLEITTNFSGTAQIPWIAFSLNSSVKYFNALTNLKIFDFNGSRGKAMLPL